MKDTGAAYRSNEIQRHGRQTHAQVDVGTGHVLVLEDLDDFEERVASNLSPSHSPLYISNHQFSILLYGYDVSRISYYMAMM